MKIKLKIIINIFLLITLLISICSCNFSKNEGLTYNIITEPENMDPQVASDKSSLVIISNVFEGLMRIDENNNLVTGIAEKYEISETNLEYTFYLKENACWSNGEKIAAADFVFAFKRIFSKDTKSPGVRFFSSILNAEEVLNETKNSEQLGVKAIDEKTIKFTLKNEDKKFLNNLTLPSAMPCNEKFFTETKGRYGLEKSTLVFSGPFKISSWVHNSFIYTVKNQGYVTTEVYPSSINFEIEPDYSQRLKLFQNEKTIAMNIDYKDINTLNSEKFDKVVYNDTVWLLAFNLNDNDFKNENLRKALISSFNKDSYKNNMNEYYSTSSSIIPPIISYGEKSYYENYSNNFNYEYSLEQAKKYYNIFLEEKGIERLSGANILVPDDSQHRYNISYIQQVWQKEIGVFINLEILSLEDIEKRMTQGDYKIALIPIKADSNDISSVLSRFSSENNKNVYGFSNSEYDSLLNKAYNENNYDKAYEYFSQCEKILKNSNFIVPMYYQASIYAFKKEFTGIGFSPFGNIITFQHAKNK